MLAWGRGRVLGLLWLVGAALTLAVVLLPYAGRGEVELRGLVAATAALLGVALLRAPEPPEWVLHALLAFGVAVITFCTSLGVPEVEGIFFLLPIVYAFATFPARRAVPHLALTAVGLTVVVLGPAGDRSVAPGVTLVLDFGIAAVIGASVGLLVRGRELAVLRGARDRRIAETLQRTLLPERLPMPAGALVAARYVAAEDDADVGGDVYDAIDLGDGRVLVAIGDVSGKGLTAAVTVGKVRNALRAYALEDPSPAEVLRRVDRLLLSTAEQDGTPMVTLAVAVADLRAGTLTYSLGGHLPPLLLRADGKPSFLDLAEGRPLGVLDGARFSEVVTPLCPGDRVLLFTDGLIERRGPDIDGAFARLRAVAADTEGVDALIDAALGAFDLPARDDVALLAFGLEPAGEQPHGAAAALRPHPAAT